MKTPLLWFDRETYPDVLQLMLDRQNLPQTWNEWEVTALAEEEQLRVTGEDVERISFDPGEFLTFCVRSGIGTNAAGRAQYAAVKLEDPAAVPVR